jgi:hypothetical protein
MRPTVAWSQLQSKVNGDGQECPSHTSNFNVKGDKQECPSHTSRTRDKRYEHGEEFSRCFLQSVVRTPCRAGTAARGHGLLRLRECFASRSIHSAQDDSFCGAIPGRNAHFGKSHNKNIDRRRQTNPTSVILSEAASRLREACESKDPMPVVSATNTARRSHCASYRVGLERLAVPVLPHAGMGSFDFVTASHRSAVTPLRMTEL